MKTTEAYNLAKLNQERTNLADTNGLQQCEYHRAPHRTDLAKCYLIDIFSINNEKNLINFQLQSVQNCTFSKLFNLIQIFSIYT